MEDAIEWLSNQFWSGKRWFIVEVSGGIVGRPACYANYLDAATDCRRRNEQGGSFRIRVLGSVLKEWNLPGPMESSWQDRERLREVVGQYPVQLYQSAVEWEEELLRGNYYPVVWEKVTEPLLAIRKYVIVHQYQKGRVSFREVYSTSEFPNAIVALRDHARNFRDQTGCLLLFGQFLDCPIDYKGGLYDLNVTVILYRAEWQGGLIPEIVEVHDPVSPVVRSFPMFVRYHRQRGTLSFYDGGLKRIDPGDEPDFIDLRMFDFRGKVIV